MEDKDRASLLLEHYHRAVDELGQELKTRTRLVLLASGLLLLLLFGASSPKAEGLLNCWVGKSLSLEAGTAPCDPDTTQRWLNLRFITSILWFGLCSTMILYYARSIAIERQARYLRRLERRLSEALGREWVSRYLDARVDRPLYFRVASGAYSLLMVLLLGVAMAFLIYRALTLQKSGEGFYLAIDLAIVLFLLAISGVFLVSCWQEMTRRDSPASASPNRPKARE